MLLLVLDAALLPAYSLHYCAFSPLGGGFVGDRLYSMMPRLAMGGWLLGVAFSAMIRPKRVLLAKALP